MLWGMVWGLLEKLTWGLQMMLEGPRALLGVINSRQQIPVAPHANGKVNTGDARC